MVRRRFGYIRKLKSGRFQASYQTPNGQRHLNQIATQQGRSDVSRFPEFLQDADLRAYDRQFDTMGDRIGEVFANTQTELMTPAFIQAAQASGTRIAELVDACNAASKP